MRPAVWRRFRRPELNSRVEPFDRPGNSGVMRP